MFLKPQRTPFFRSPDYHSAMPLFSADDPADQWKYVWMRRVYAVCILLAAAVALLYCITLANDGIALVGEELSPENRHIANAAGFLAAIALASILIGGSVAFTIATFGSSPLQGPRFGGNRSLARLLAPPIVALLIFSTIVGIEIGNIRAAHDEWAPDIAQDESLSAAWLKMPDDQRLAAMRAHYWTSWSMTAAEKGALSAFLDRHAMEWATTRDIAEVVQTYYNNIERSRGDAFMAAWLAQHSSPER